jgi:shikimate dehydrogenase
MTIPRACIFGWPARQSRSPLIHGYWLDLYGIAGEYDCVELPPIEFPNFLGRLELNGFVGGNVTAPHKEAAFAVVAETHPAAAAMQAVNTLWLEDGRLHGDNTDGIGFLSNLDEHAPGWDGRTGSAVVLGAGGAARAVVHALLQRGVGSIHVVNRSRRRAEDLHDLFGARVQAHGWEALPGLLEQADLLCNSTSLGMVGKEPLQIDLDALPSTALVTDLVYAPLETALLKQARARGLQAVDGLGMLLHQAVPGFERWFGRRPEVTPQLRALVVADLATPR